MVPMDLPRLPAPYQPQGLRTLLPFLFNRRAWGFFALRGRAGEACKETKPCCWLSRIPVVLFERLTSVVFMPRESVSLRQAHTSTTETIKLTNAMTNN